MNVSNSSDINLESSVFKGNDSTDKLQAVIAGFRPIEITRETTIKDEYDNSFNITHTNKKNKYEPPVQGIWSPAIADSTPLQIWEGTVINVNNDDKVMNVLLEAKLDQVPRHSASIDLEWVSDQDKDLLVPGAVFYLTLFKRTKRGSIENSQELRFRRRPSWSKAQVDRIEKTAEVLLAKMKTLPRAE